MTTYALEPLNATTQAEMEQILGAHWQEIAGDRDVVKLDPDWPAYYALQERGIYQMVVVRREGVMIGYHVSFVQPHLHYKSTLHAVTDLYFVMPEYRAGRTGLRLFQFVEKCWQERGVVKAFTACKTYLDHSDLFAYMGWNFREKTFVKLL